MSTTVIIDSFRFAPSATPGSISVRATDVAYAQVIGSVEFGNSWDRAYPVASSTNKRVTGWRFQANIPAGATITSATVKVTHSQNATWVSADDFDVYAEDVDSSTLATNEPDAESKSGNVTTATVNWSIVGAYLNGDVFTSPDLSAVVQEVVDRGGWASGNYLTVWGISTGGGNDAHQVWSVETVSESLRPLLDVGYTA